LKTAVESVYFLGTYCGTFWWNIPSVDLAPLWSMVRMAYKPAAATIGGVSTYIYVV
jgi:hypothetical protein